MVTGVRETVEFGLMEASTKLVAALRELIETVRTCDLEQAQGDGVDIAELASRIESHSRELTPYVVDAAPAQGGLRNESPRVDFDQIRDVADGAILDIFPYSPLIGVLNPVAPPISLWRDGATVRGCGRIPTAMNGPPAAVHGGFVAAVLDELLGMAAIVAGLGGFTGTLTVRYLRPTPLNTDLDLEARVDSSEGRKVHVSGQISAEGPEGTYVCATAEATFIRPADRANLAIKSGYHKIEYTE